MLKELTRYEMMNKQLCFFLNWWLALFWAKNVFVYVKGLQKNLGTVGKFGAYFVSILHQHNKNILSTLLN